MVSKSRKITLDASNRQLTTDASNRQLTTVRNNGCHFGFTTKLTGNALKKVMNPPAPSMAKQMTSSTGDLNRPIPMRGKVTHTQLSNAVLVGP